jgi:predicted nucleotidyltransferase
VRHISRRDFLLERKAAMQPEIQPTADQLSVLNRRAEKLLEPIETQPKEKKSVTRPSEILSFPYIHEGLGHTGDPPKTKIWASCRF